ncbi:AAA family ATPase [Micromonospora aurantiaca (nom. illeg.)]|uniref:AAA family ATPase n=1 Tax=Micromonospora aurantiaca (nom. illeg.) TaxID=47850 RepID=UPI003EC1430C
MRLIRAQVFKYKAIEDSNEVAIDDQVTVLVGINESGKSAFLEALNKSRPAVSDVEFDYISDYPRRDLVIYEAQHKTKPAEVTELTYRLSVAEVAAVNEDVGFDLLDESFIFSVTHNYGNGVTIGIEVDREASFVESIVDASPLTSDIKEKVRSAGGIRQLIAALESEDLNEQGASFLQSLTGKYTPDKVNWPSLLENYVWRKHLSPHIPRFLYFSDYNILPGKINLPSLQSDIDNGVKIDAARQTALNLFDMAGIEMSKLAQPDSYEEVKARLEAISNNISDKVFKYWKQNTDLEVEFDIRPDPHDTAPFNNGNNLYVRVRNRRHRVSVPFDQRSKGFIWFFSFIAWFDSVKKGPDGKGGLVLLLDEPGLSLHGLAQKDLLDYIDNLSSQHQTIYTTHSPFMINSDRLHQVRTVEDRDRVGTKISDSLGGTDERTLFPLQAGLGYTIAQNLFIAKKNLLVEGPADLIFLRFFATILEQVGRVTLRDDVVIVPVGGLDKIATFVSLLHGNDLDMVVLHDYAGKADQRLEALIRDKILKAKQVLNYGQFRTGGAAGLLPTDVEDMISEALYLELFESAYANELGGNSISTTSLPSGDRIVQRIETYLKANNLSVRPSGGYNHYLVANHLATKPPTSGQIDTNTLDRFEALFKAINGLFP